MALNGSSSKRKRKDLATYLKTGLLNVLLNLTSFIPDDSYGRFIYKLYTGRSLNLDNPETFDEKLWWLKLNDHNPLLSICSDKVAVREYVEKCGLSHILTQIYGVYEDAEDIDFTEFTDEVIIKCNHSSGMNMIYSPDNFNGSISLSVKLLNLQLSCKYYLLLRERNYNIKPKLICEKVLRNSDGTLPSDYRFFCFDGKAKFFLYDTDLCTEDGRHSKDGRRNVYDMDFNLLNVRLTRKNFDPASAKKPEAFDEMRRYAEILAQPFPFCRVDFFNVEGRVYLGEMGFYQNGACNKITPREWDLELGAEIDLSHPGVELNSTRLGPRKRR
ncbi:MAG: ATP-grasp fold amidoligase family protein [Spirochaetia bacterium]